MTDKDYALAHAQAMVNEMNQDNDFTADMVVSALVLMVLYEEDGSKYYRAVPSRDLRTWEAMGLMEFQKMQFQGKITEAWVSDENNFDGS